MINHAEKINCGAFINENFSLILGRRLFQRNLIIESDLNAMVQSGRNLIDVLQASGQERVEVDSLALSDTHTR